MSATDQPVTPLVRDALSDGRELVRLEIELARNELRQELRALVRVAIAAGVALVTGLLTLSTLGVALVLALGGTVVAALCVAGGLLVVTAVVAALTYAVLPHEFMNRTRTRVRDDIAQIKENIA